MLSTSLQKHSTNLISLITDYNISTAFSYKWVDPKFGDIHSPDVIVSTSEDLSNNCLIVRVETRCKLCAKFGVGRIIAAQQTIVEEIFEDDLKGVLFVVQDMVKLQTTMLFELHVTRATVRDSGYLKDCLKALRSV